MDAVLVYRIGHNHSSWVFYFLAIFTGPCSSRNVWPIRIKRYAPLENTFCKIKNIFFHKIFSGIIAIPFLLGTIFHGEMTALLLYGVLCLYAAIALNIALKYHQYTPLYPNGRSQNISGILTMLMLLPGGVIITFSYAIWKYFSAEQNLKSLYA
ncbi:MAG: hypothetical protein IPP49_02180 [Saprospiraceae bacterium]|nr:hypothetical protein [Saprospiraceae bacterium]